MEIFANFRDPLTDPYLLFIKNRYSKYSISFWYDKVPDSNSQLSVNPYNILFVHEPNEFFGFHNIVAKYGYVFTVILTWNDALINSLPNALCFTYNGQTLDDTFIDNLKPKSFNVSFLAGTKDLVAGHKLRQEILKVGDSINIPKKWYRVLEDFDLQNNVRPGYGNYGKDLSHIPPGVDPIGYGRRALFEDSMFNVVVENVSYNNWYNKIGDNFLTKTVPIYWGCPNISQFGYDERGIIRFSTKEELIEIVNSLTPDKYYDMLPYVDFNYRVAKVDTFENNISLFFNELIKTNNL